tara:strand:- start:13259 stop:13522 length:264 start_codon:yes stop_codon:yes gene_type:complete
MKIEFKKRTINLDLYGETFAVAFPTARQLDDYLKKLKQIGKGELESSDFELTQALFEECGLPKEKIQDMELGHLEELTQLILGQKKS